MTARCPVCNKILIDGKCLFCDLKKSLINDSVACETIAEKDSHGQATGAEESIPDISVECKFETDLLAGSSQEVKLCSVVLRNSGREARVSVVVFVEGAVDSHTTQTVPDYGSRELQITSGSKRFRVEYGADFDVAVEIRTLGGTTIHRQSSTVRVRPVFDISLKEIKEDIPMWVTPNVPEVKDMLSSGGAVLSALAKKGMSAITGYQGNDPEDILRRVIIQMDAVYAAIQSLHMKYVSDTESMGNALTFNFQRVKLPRKTLSERTGNCIELSCLFASIFEAMGLYPVIVFPPGHAMVGVVTSSEGLPEVGGFRLKSAPYVFDFSISDVGNGHGDRLQGIFLESTSVCGESSFKDSLESALQTLTENRFRILRDEEFTVVTYKRHFEGKRPMTW